MDKKIIDKKQGVEDTELLKEEKDPKQNYIFQKTNITKTGFIIILVALILIVIGITISGAFFGSDVQNP
ncbi:hypothetical protein [Arenibacter certesii]|nr:hypothetical protein [Arenibacter certesii]